MSIRHRIAIAAAAAVCALPGLAHAQASIGTRLVTTGLVRPIFVTHAPGDESRLFIIEKQGRIRIFNLETNTLNSDWFLDIDPLVTGGTSTSSEQGLLGLAFHPDYQNNGYFYVNYTSVSGSGDTQVVRYQRGADDDHATTSGALTLMSFDQPYSNHNGGFISFGPDGMLYIFTGDGGSAGDPGDRAQDVTSQRLGKILRIDVDGGTPYAIPSDNPFAGGGGDREIWAWGLRNPWRSAFDRETGDLWIADVGQNAREEVNFVRAGTGNGRNYGWRCMEGQSCYTSSSGCSCNAANLTDPQYQYLHNSSGGYSITGGYPYRGCAMPDYQGTYFFADYVTANFWSAVPQKSGALTVTSQTSALRVAQNGGGTQSAITSFGEDAKGEIYICNQNSGRIYKIIPLDLPEDCGPPPSPYDLNGDGCVDGGDIGIFVTQWGTPNSFADFNGDGETNSADLGMLLGGWGCQG